MRISLAIIGLLLPFFLCGQNAVSVETFSPLFNKQWTGELTYLDYSSNEETSIPVTMTVEPDSDRSVVLSIVYPGEESANDVTRIKISKDGKEFNGQKVQAVEALGNGTTEIVTTERGKDNGRAAEMTYTYVIGPRIYSSEKFVRYEGADHAFLRNSFAMHPADQ